MSLLIFIIVLSILVIVHEWGHFITAKAMGIGVEKFSVGFGPKLFSRMRHGTEFMICLIPLGGYVKLAGDERSACRGTPEEFFSHPPGHRAAVIAMGPLINFVFAYLCFYFIFMTGFPMLAPQIGKIMEGYPAAVAGLREGDRIIRIDSQPVGSWEDIQEYVMNSQGASLRVTLLRNGEELAKTVVPQERPVKNIFGQEERIRLIGIQPQAEIILVTFGAGESLGKAWDQLTGVVTLTFRALYHVVTGAMSAQEAFAGPIRIFDVIREAAEMGLSSLIYIVAVISTSLAIFNLFPVPVLDGGHLLLLAVEKIRRRPLSIRVEEGLTKFGFSLLMCLMVFVLYNDLLQVGWMEHLKGFVHALWR